MKALRLAEKSLWLVVVLSLIGVFSVLFELVPLVDTYTHSKDAEAAPDMNPQECPPGQEKARGCKWVQHRETGKCQWKPLVSVAWPWQEVPEGTCPSLVQNTSTVPVVTKTKEPPVDTTATKEIVPLNTATATPITKLPTVTQPASGASPTVCPTKQTTPDQLVTASTQEPLESCDPCKTAQKQADALKQLADAVSKFVDFFISKGK